VAFILTMPAASIAQVAGDVFGVKSAILGLDALGFGEYQRERSEDTQAIDDAEDFIFGHNFTGVPEAFK